MIANSPPAIIEYVPVHAFGTYDDEQGKPYEMGSDWLFIPVEHRPVWVRLDALRRYPKPLSRQGAGEVQFYGVCTGQVWGGGGNPYAPASSSLAPSAFRFSDGTGEVVVSGNFYAEVGERWIIAGRYEESGGQVYVQSYRTEWLPDPPDSLWIDRVLGSVR
ncbi:MAG: hypothetical protein IT209_00820 [Armatimonadetes bacterium]|nr:hypothetical protein [Armatimonadota bacterium]